MSVTSRTIIDVECDYCQERSEWVGVRRIVDGVAQAEAQGWRIMKMGRGWKAVCPVCLEKVGL